MIRLESGIYLSEVAGNKVKVIYCGKNVCELYINNEFKGRAPFDYVRERLMIWENKKDLLTAYIIPYPFKQLVPLIDVYV
ncbi:hypothetical protein [Fictibacillus terranigra]|uniref:Uncharacterized protein n=1 Tax=Fictibacillus terranigra TaxID=3058424 RepID=A0ABT8E3B2_9BACL|nr:hypothetical protein [Fictibacillus sp. CENA-BCM004]MDN4072394.1 hypothetical protein [Fictibacillus sp. CENA-BCM004]